MAPTERISSRSSNSLIYCVIFIVYKQFTNVTAGSVRHTGRKLETDVLGFKYKIHFTMHRTMYDLIYRKRKVKNVNLTLEAPCIIFLLYIYIPTRYTMQLHWLIVY